jgi:hypothetical protein
MTLIKEDKKAYFTIAIAIRTVSEANEHLCCSDLLKQLNNKQQNAALHIVIK